MKVKILIVCLSFGLIAISYSQSPEETKVAQAVESLRKAMVDADATTLASLTSDVLSYGHSSGTLEDKTAYINAITSKKNDFKSIEQSNQTIKMKGGIAIVRHTFKAELLVNGTPVSPNIGVLQVWQKEKGKWKLIARQAYKI
jgi:ketosteroid isomerase-like protein